MFFPPAGPHLTAVQATELDDSYFQSRPFGYFASRIAALAAGHRTDEGREPTDIEADLAAALGGTTASDFLDFDDSDRELQIVTDAFALRHHAAESLVRLYHGLTLGVASQGSVPCVWSAIAEGPTKTVDLVNEARAHLLSPAGHESFWTLVFPQTIAGQHEQEKQIHQALNVIGDWLHHAMALLVRSDLNINAANNKVKHGLAIRARNDLRLTVTTQPPNPDGTIPLSSLTGDQSFDIFDSPVLDYLARPPKQENRKQGLEVTSLRLIPSTLLAETWLISVAHAAMFHVAAARHFADRDIAFQPFPKLPLGPTPVKLLGEAVVGMRQPLTTPPDGGPLDRTTGIAFRTRFLPLQVDFAGAIKAKVVSG